MTEHDIQKELNDAISARGLSTAKLSELSGVPERFLEALRAGNFDALPSAPYVRGYLIKLGHILGINGSEWWSNFKMYHEPKSSGVKDALPVNRFSARRNLKTKIIMVLAVLALAAYAAARFNIIIGKPSLVIYNPSPTTLITNSERMRITGKVDSGNSLSINGDSVPISENGEFEKELSLSPGVNNIEFVAKRFLGREIRETKKIVFQP